MKTIKKSLAILLFALMPALANAQSIPARLELSRVEINDGERAIEVFKQIKDGVSSYYLSVGHLGIGNEILQLQFDPLFELFIPLGDNLDEAVETMEQIKGWYGQSGSEQFEIPGCLAPGFPTSELETVTVIPRRLLLSRNLIFKVKRDGYERNTYIPRSDFSSVLSGLKFYRKLHPKE